MRVDVVNAPFQKRTFGVSIGDVTAIDGWAEHVTAQLGVSEQAAFRARVCIAELAANVLEHGICHADNDHIVITIDGVVDGIKVEFLDTRAAFDPTVKSSGDQSDTSIGGGRGLLLLHAYADNLSYATDGTYNRVAFRIRSD